MAGYRPKMLLDVPGSDAGNAKALAGAMEIRREEVGFDVELNVLDLTASIDQI